MNNSPISFRIWHKPSRSWCDQNTYMISPQGKVINVEEGDQQNYVAQPFTGILAENRAKIYLDDIIFADEAAYRVVFELGMFCVRANGDEKPTPLYEYEGDCIVTGNIMENEGLLAEFN